MPTELSYFLEEFSSELLVGKGFSPNTVKAYVSDVSDLQAFMESKNQTEIEDLDLELVRDWLWRASEKGLTKTTWLENLLLFEHSLLGFTKTENWLLIQG